MSPVDRAEDTYQKLRSYPRKGAMLLACGKCQRKLKDNREGLGKLRKPLKKLAKAHGAKLLVVNTPCLKICPKGAVVVCTQAQLARGEFSLLHSAREFEPLVDAALEATSRP